MRNRSHNNDGKRAEGLSEAGRAELLRIVAETRETRILSVVIEGQRIWIKHFDAVSPGFAKWAHAAAPISALHPFLRSSPWLTPQGMAQRGERKSAAFQRAGFAVARQLLVDGPVVVTADCRPIVAHRLYGLAHDGEAEGHDALLIQCAEALGRAHAAGLCHGRPHPRDLFVADGAIGFLDFEEEPEAAMPLPVAQARDAWLLMQQIAGATLTPGADRDAFDGWRREAPPGAVAELRKAVSLFSPVTSILSVIEKTGLLGADGRRVRDAGLLLRDIFQTKPADAPSARQPESLGND